jgi:RNA polymerase sigma-70 factor (ECF subfamily)
MPETTAPVTKSPDERLRELMVSYQEGSASAFDELYSLLAPRLYHYLVTLCRNRPLAEDLLQESFLQLHRSRRTYRPDAPVKPWAFAIARHVFLVHRRASRCRDRAATDLIEPAAEDSQHTSLGDRRRLSRALGALSKERRDAVILHHMLGFSFSEIAARFGIRAGAARVRASRGMSALRSLLGPGREPQG